MRTHPLLSRLKTVRRDGALIETLSERERPASLQEAYAISAALTASQSVVGYKIGATNDHGRALLGLEAPFFGRILRDTLHRSPVTLRLDGRVMAVEAEIGCEMGADLPARNAIYTRGEVAAAVRRVVPLLELNAPSYREPFSVGGLCLIADNGVNAGAVVGAPGSVGLDAIAYAQVVLKTNSGPSRKGHSAAPPDDPLSVLTWLINTLSAQGLGVQAGHVIATGAMMPPLEVAEECTLEADFAALGSVQIAFIA